MKKSAFTFFIVLAAAVLTAFGQGIGDRNRPADSNGGIYSIQGRVLLPDGKPAAGIKIAISGTDGNTSATTDRDGVFQTSAHSGNYVVSATVEGYPTENESIAIDRDSPPSQVYSIVLYIRNPGQRKGDIYSNNPLFKDVPKTALDKFRKAEDKLHANDAKGAISLFDEAVAEYPNFAAAFYERGSAYIKTNDLDKALESFVKAIQIKPDYIEAKYSVGYTQFLKKNYEVASAVFDDVLKEKDMPEAQLNLGISLVYIKNPDAAVPHLKKAIAARDDESMALAHRFLGAVYMQKKQNGEAAAELEKYLKLVPKAPDAEKLRTTISDLRKTS
ncbi:MAG: tetratricopeptide repeat protein [Acidobacteriota bacterium]